MFFERIEHYSMPNTQEGREFAEEIMLALRCSGHEPIRKDTTATVAVEVAELTELNDNDVIPQVWQKSSGKNLIETNIFDIEEIHHNCTVQILRNSVTGEVSVGWWPNDNKPIGTKEGK